MSRRSWITLGAALLLAGFTVRAADEHAQHAQHVPKVEKPRIFWTTPIAIRFQLRRLGNTELLLLDRDRNDKKYIPVYETMLIRPGLLPKYRIESVDALVHAKSSDPATVLLAAIRAAGGEENTDGVLYELGQLLLDLPGEQLSAHREAFETRVIENDHPVVRRIGYAGRITTGGKIDEIWQQAEQADHLSALLGSLPMVRSAERRAALYPRIKPLLTGTSDEALQATAIEVLGGMVGHEEEIFGTLAAFVAKGRQVGPAARALSRMNRSHWPADRLAPLAASIVKFIQQTSAEERTQPHVIDAVQLGNDIADRLPAEQRGPLRNTLRSLGATVILLRTVRHEMRYDKKFFAVQAGTMVQVILENVDVMPHNVVVVKPGAIEPVGVAAETMQARLGEDRPFVPKTDNVLFASRLVQPEKRDRLSFKAPAEPGEYPYVCTFPGHWRRMYGVMVVVEDLEAWLARPTEPDDPLGNTREFVKNWTIDDFSADLKKRGAGRQFDRGKHVFTEAGCVLCHVLRGEGGKIGPDLAEVFDRWKGDRREVLLQILDPSAVVEEKYRDTIIETVDGDMVVGLIITRDDKTVTLVTNPQNPVPFDLDADLIDSERKSELSRMPSGVMDIFSREEVLDLLAYIESAGSALHEIYAP